MRTEPPEVLSIVTALKKVVQALFCTGKSRRWSTWGGFFSCCGWRCSASKPTQSFTHTEAIMAILTIDMRNGRTDGQKRLLASALLDVVSKATGESRDNVFLVIHESRGIDFVENGHHLPDYVKS
jgi:4-oxalocrotonate tautomerase